MSIDISQIQFILEKLAIFNDELGNVEIDVAVLRAQVGQIIWMQRAVLIMVIGFVGTKILRATFNNRKNNK